MKIIDFWYKKKLEKYNFNKIILIGSKSPLILNIIRISDKPCAHGYKQLLNKNSIVINAIEYK